MINSRTMLTHNATRIGNKKRITKAKPIIMKKMSEPVDVPLCRECCHFVDATLAPNGWCYAEKSVIFGNKIYVDGNWKACENFKGKRLS